MQNISVYNCMEQGLEMLEKSHIINIHSLSFYRNYANGANPRLALQGIQALDLSNSRFRSSVDEVIKTQTVKDTTNVCVLVTAFLVT